MRRTTIDLARTISQTLITSSSSPFYHQQQSWTPLLDQTLHKLLPDQNSLTPQLVSNVINPYLTHHPSLALGFFNWATQQPGFSHTSSTYTPLLKSLSHSRQFNSIDKILKQIRFEKVIIETCVYGEIIKSFLAVGKTHLAYSVFRDIGCGVGSGICNCLLAGLASDGNFKCARKVFDEMCEKGVGFSTIGFGVFVWWVCREMEIGQVFGLFDGVMRNKEVGFDGSIVALLVVHGLCKVGRVKDAVFALGELRVLGCKPDFMAYRVVAESLRVMGEVVETEVVLKRKRKLGVAPRVEDYREFIFQLVKERLTNEAKELGEVIVSGDFPIQDDVLNVLIGSVSGIDPLLAVWFMKFMLDKERFPTLLSVMNLSESLCKHGKTDELVEIFGLLSAREYFGNLDSYNVMISFLCKGGRVKEAYSVLQEMKKKGLIPDVSSYNYILEACCRDDLVRPAKRLWDEMFASGCYGNLESYKILIRKFSEVGEVEEACHLFQHMLGKGLEPDAEMYKSMVECLCLTKDLETAHAVFNKCTERDVKLENNLLSAFVISLCKEGFLLPASKLLRELPCGMEHLEHHVAILKQLAYIDNLTIATDQMKWIAARSHVLLDAIQTELSASLSSSLKPHPLLLVLEQVLFLDGMPRSRSLNI